MKDEFSQKEKEFFLRLKEGNSTKNKTIFVALLSLLILGLIIDALNGFYILSNAKTVFWGIGGIILFALFYLFVEGVYIRIRSKNNISHPSIKRVLHLFVLLFFAGIAIAGSWFLFKELGW